MTVDAERLEGQRVQVISLNVLVLFIISSLSVGFEVKGSGTNRDVKGGPEGNQSDCSCGQMFPENHKAFPVLGRLWGAAQSCPKIVRRNMGFTPPKSSTNVA